MNKIDPIWEEKYQQGAGCTYPWDVIVTFVFRYAPRDRERAEVKILELGCATGCNLLFAAREGFSVSGIEGSQAAVKAAKQRFVDEGLVAELVAGDFSELPFDDAEFDLVFDRGALTCVGTEHLRQTVAQVKRVLKPGGHFFFNPYCDSHSSYRAGVQVDDGLTDNITGGAVANFGAVRFSSRRDIDDILKEGWSLESVERLELTDMLAPNGDIHAEWRVVAERI